MSQNDRLQKCNQPFPFAGKTELCQRALGHRSGPHWFLPDEKPAQHSDPPGPPTICKCGGARSYHRPEDRRDHEYEPRYEPMAWRDGYKRGFQEGMRVADATPELRGFGT